MKINKIHIILVLMVVVMTIAACDNDTGPEGAYVGGSDGLISSFVVGEPPEMVLDANSEEFYITLLIKNNGESTIEPGKARVTLTGIDKSQFSISDLTKTNENAIDSVHKDRDKVVPGGEDQVSYTAKYIPDLNADFPVTIGANICYTYETKSQSLLCLRKDVTRRSSLTEDCIIDSEKTIENSGAPIHMASINERPIGKNQIRLSFDVENVGVGTPYEKSSFDSGICNKKDEDKDYVNVKLIPTGDLRISCPLLNNGKEGAVRLVNNKKTITCEIDTSNLQETSYESPLNINLEYYYFNFVSKGIVVENAIL